MRVQGSERLGLARLSPCEDRTYAGFDRTRRGVDLDVLEGHMSMNGLGGGSGDSGKAIASLALTTF